MAPLIALASTFLLTTLAARLGVHALDGLVLRLRIALAAMFVLTASAHWGRRRPDLVRMVPPAFGWAEGWVTLTGVAELLGAAGLVLAPTAGYAALGLTLLLLAVFPANVRAAREHLTLDGRAATPLVPRVLLQLLFLACTIAVAVTTLASRP